VQVHQDHVGLEVQSQGHRRPAVRRRTHHLDAVRGREQGHQSLPELVVVVDDEDP
jgi:hypothetical protein